MDLPFTVLGLKPPRLRKPPTVSRPSSLQVFSLVFVGYFLIVSGIIYDVIQEPPSMGQERGPDGTIRPVAFMPFRINGQYIIEGLTAGFMFCVGAVGFIVLDMAADKNKGAKVRYMLLVGGSLCLVTAYNLCLVFLRMKIPGYLSAQ